MFSSLNDLLVNVDLYRSIIYNLGAFGVGFVVLVFAWSWQRSGLKSLTLRAEDQLEETGRLPISLRRHLSRETARLESLLTMPTKVGTLGTVIGLMLAFYSFSSMEFGELSTKASIAQMFPDISLAFSTTAFGLIINMMFEVFARSPLQDAYWVMDHSDDDQDVDDTEGDERKDAKVDECDTEAGQDDAVRGWLKG